MTDHERIAVQSRSPLRTDRGRTSRRCGCPPGTRHSTPAHTRAHEAKGTAAMRIAVGSDHAGFHLKEHVKAALTALGHDIVDVGPATPGSVDYPQFAADAARLVAGGDAQRGVLSCGSGAGGVIVANRVAGGGGVTARDAPGPELGRRHNDAN